MSEPQFDLFGDPIAQPSHLPSPPDGAVGQANVGRARNSKRVATEAKVQPTSLDTEALCALRDALPARAYFGTSSWSFSGWAGLVYDGAYSEQVLSRYGLAAYAQHPLLRTVGIDRTFYAPMSESEFRAYAKQVECVNPEFRFLVKAPMLFTGPRLRAESGMWIDNEAFLNAPLVAAQHVIPATEGLGDCCGPLVFQFPPLGSRFTRSPARFADQLAEFLLALPKLSGDAVYAVEVRDPELLIDNYLAALCAGGATHCIAIHARMPQAREQARFWQESSATLPLVIRWSLHSGFKYEEAKERYAPFNAIVDRDNEGRNQIAALIETAHATSRSSFTIINNKAEGSAPLSVRRIAELLSVSTNSSR
jgi:uncharacterized protein YecE (DUF72 family)